MRNAKTFQHLNNLITSSAEKSPFAILQINFETNHRNIWTPTSISISVEENGHIPKSVLLTTADVDWMELKWANSFEFVVGFSLHNKQEISQFWGVKHAKIFIKFTREFGYFVD